ncbi:MAG: GmrSD restriction endonuclease domain-containing protein, partial [Brevinema sp.]
FQTNKNGTVIGGLWYDHFTASYITNPKDLQIDHIVPFKEAFRSQQHTWTIEEINEFYNSPLLSALLPVYKDENQRKSDSKEYLPPNPAFQKIYQDMWIYTKIHYKLND